MPIDDERYPASRKSNNPMFKKDGVTRSNAPKFTPAQRRKMCELIAKRHTFAEITKFFKDEYEITVYTGDIYYYRDSKKWKPMIEELRSKFDEALVEEYLYSKKNRLRELAKVVRGNKDKGKIAAIEAARKECEGEKVEVSGGAKIVVEIVSFKDEEKSDE